MFQNCYSLSYIPDILKLNIKKANFTFLGCCSLLNFADILNKKHFITAYKIGIEIRNEDQNDWIQNGNKMYTIIKKFSKIPTSSEKAFQILLNQNFPNISIRIYEGNNVYVNQNHFLGEMHLNNINIFGNILYKVKFSVNLYYQLTVTITIDSLGIKNEEIIGKITHAIVDKDLKTIKIYN